MALERVLDAVDGELDRARPSHPDQERGLGIERPRLPRCEVVRGGCRVVATARLDRRAFGLTWNAVMEGGGIVVGDAVEVTVEAELIRG